MEILILPTPSVTDSAISASGLPNHRVAPAEYQYVRQCRANVHLQLRLHPFWIDAMRCTNPTASVSAPVRAIKSAACAGSCRSLVKHHLLPTFLFVRWFPFTLNRHANRVSEANHFCGQPTFSSYGSSEPSIITEVNPQESHAKHALQRHHDRGAVQTGRTTLGNFANVSEKGIAHKISSLGWMAIIAGVFVASASSTLREGNSYPPH